jgi:hypothetical protein
MIMMTEVDAMIEWLDRINSHYEFTGLGMEFITFTYESDALMFKLRFGV